MNYNLLKQLRKEKKISLIKLSEMTGVSRNTLSCIENGKCNPTANTLETICNKLNIKIKLIN